MNKKIRIGLQRNHFRAILRDALVEGDSQALRDQRFARKRHPHYCENNYPLDVSKGGDSKHTFSKDRHQASLIFQFIIYKT